MVTFLRKAYSSGIKSLTSPLLTDNPGFTFH